MHERGDELFLSLYPMLRRPAVRAALLFSDKVRANRDHLCWRAWFGFYFRMYVV